MTHKVTKPIALDESFRTTGLKPQNIADVLANKLDAIKSAIENGGSGEMEAAFECHYNVTSATDIYNAMQEKKVPFFYNNGVVAQLWKVETNKYTFRTTSTRVVEGENILDIVDYIVNGSVWSTTTKTISGGSSSQQAYLAKVESSVNFDTTGLSGMQSIISVNDVPADGVYQLSIFMCITPKTASATKSDLVFQFTGTSGTGMPNTTFHAVVDDSQTFAQQLSFSTTLNLKAGTNSLKMACGGLNTEYLVFVDDLTVAQIVNGVYHNGDKFEDVNDLTEASDFNADDELLVVSPNSTRKMLWTTLANKVLGFIKRLSTTITAFRTGDVIPVDGPSGTAKMSKDDLLKETAENALAKAVDNLLLIGDTSDYTSFNELPIGSMVLVAAALSDGPSSGSAGSCITLGSKGTTTVKSQFFISAQNSTICCRRYHDGAWDGWQYIVSRAELNAAVADLTLDVDTLFEILNASKSSFTWTDSTFVKGDGTIASNPALQLSNGITLADGFSLSVKCRGAASAESVSIIAEKYGANYIPLVKNIDDSLREYSYANNSGASKTVVISCKVQDAPTFAVLKNDTIDNASNFVNFFFSPTRTALLVGTDGKYVKGNGDLLSNPVLNLSQSFTLHPSQSISVSVTSSSTGGAVSVIASYDGANYHSLVNNTDANLREYNYTNKSSEDLTVYVSFKDGSEGNVVTIYNDKQNAEEDALVYTPSLSVYQSLAVIGDSYASGALWKNNVSYGDHYPISWPQVIGRMCGIEVTNYTRGGASTRSFVADTTERGYAQMMSDVAKDIYFVVLGLNDSSSLGLEYLGVVSDIGTDADTFYGNYSKIIDGIQSHAPNAKIVLFTTPFTGTTYNRDAFNSAIDNLATHYSLPCIHLYEDGFFTTSPMFLDRPGNHPTIVGYAGMAEAIKRLVEARMLDDMIYFNAFNS